VANRNPEESKASGLTDDLTAQSEAHPYLVLPSTDLAQLLLSFVMATECPAIAHHSIRSYLFGRLLADHLGATSGRDYDEQLLFAACVMHDIGLSATADGSQRFEVDGADFAAQMLSDHGLPAADVDAVWEAIALHTSGGIAERRGLLCVLTRGGVALDFGRDTEFVTDAQASAFHAAYPRLDIGRTIVNVIVAQALRSQFKAPAYSIADGLLRERGAEAKATRLELGAAASRWGS
jgi:hypothetical protein